MAVIVTRIDMPESCIKCNSINCFLPYKKNTNREVVKKKYMAVRHEGCPLKSVEGLIESVENKMILMGIPQANRVVVIDIIAEYCGMEASNEQESAY